MAAGRDIVVIGGGHAAAQFCIGMAEAGQGGRLRLVCKEPHLPYQRPPLNRNTLSPNRALRAGPSFQPNSGKTAGRTR